MKRLVLVLCLFLIGCLSTGGARANRTQCTTLMVENQNFWDVIIYNDDGVRVGRFGGLRTEYKSNCRLNGRTESFQIRGQADAFNLSLSGHSRYLEPTDTVYIVIGPTPNLSFIGRR